MLVSVTSTDIIGNIPTIKVIKPGKAYIKDIAGKLYPKKTNISSGYYADDEIDGVLREIRNEVMYGYDSNRYVWHNLIHLAYKPGHGIIAWTAIADSKLHEVSEMFKQIHR